MSALKGALTYSFGLCGKGSNVGGQGVDPGFPQRCANPKERCQSIIRPNLSENCMKMKKIDSRVWGVHL